jgi:uncharacterized protein
MHHAPDGTPMRGLLPAELIDLTPNVWTEPFWAATAEHRLVVPRCRACGTYRFPPTPFCFRCRAQTVDWVEQSGTGVIYAFTVIRHAVIPPVVDALPLIAAVVELPETNGCRMIANIVDATSDDVYVGRKVHIGWYDVRAGTTIPVFRLA